MFEFIRKHSKIVMVVLFLLIIPSFVMFGVDGYRRSMEQGAAVATVNGADITQGEWDEAHRLTVERTRAQSPNIDARFFDTPAAKYATLERLVRERTLRAAADKYHLAPSEARLASTLQQDPSIAALRSADGKLDIAQYRQILAAQGMTPESYEARVASDMALRQVLEGISSSAVATTAQADAVLAPFFQQRNIQVASFKSADYVAKVQPNDAELQAYYDAHQAVFRKPEQADVEYVVLDIEALRQGIVPAEKDLRDFYEQNQARLVGQEERRASHILLTVPKDAPQTERDKIKAHAEQLVATLRKEPGRFAEIARKESQDPGSAAQGGDLNFFTRGAMVKPFEDAVYSMKKGDISDVVTSDFGFHIIQLTDIKAQRQRSFEEVRADLESQYRQQEAQKRFAEAADTFTNTVYEQADSLKPVADKLKLTVRTASNVGRNAAPGTAGVLANERLLTALFAPDAVEKKRNTEAVETGPSQLASARIVNYTPARTPPFAEVRDEVRQRLIREKAGEMAKKDGEARLAEWKTTPASARLPAAVDVSRGDAAAQAPAVVAAAMRAPTASLPAWVGVDTADGYAVVRVNSVAPRAANAKSDPTSERMQVTQSSASAESNAYYEWLRTQLKVQIKAPRPITITAPGAN
ncbi:SurA N-terminal domain-containing protein [Xylophilus sp. GOD-11R]|uniref:SurA N-terminal domain-containing protein n=1 Tax=Xylophilus sp. GOD-11R TaxID=3089814 RepID=UPI00298D3E5F|nr:SurA N-terminal domain-containing protein [Xylophilus sp. GOD-11R]WPB58021.1 SurA N-terminal domain-containing protein [Xylophilus sp. GOD-11R]